MGMLVHSRRIRREAQRSVDMQEQQRRLSQIEMMEGTKAQLQMEKQRREAAEAEAKTASEAKEEESKKLVVMKEYQKELEKLLEEEKQAKRDEEIVRSVQSRVLNEEWEKRAEL